MKAQNKMNLLHIIVTTISLLLVSDTPVDEPDQNPERLENQLYKPINLDPEPDHAFKPWQNVIKEIKIKKDNKKD